MKIIAHKSHKTYLLDLGNDLGQILDLGRRKLTLPYYIHSLIANMQPWQEYTGDQALLEQLLAQVQPKPVRLLNPYRGDPRPPE